MTSTVNWAFGGLASRSAYRVGCWACPAHFDAHDAEWCSCPGPEPTFVCPSCRRCFCTSPVDYRQSFWSFAPLSLWRRRRPRN